MTMKPVSIYAGGRAPNLSNGDGSPREVAYWCNPYVGLCIFRNESDIVFTNVDYDIFGMDSPMWFAYTDYCVRIARNSDAEAIGCEARKSFDFLTRNSITAGTGGEHDPGYRGEQHRFFQEVIAAGDIDNFCHTHSICRLSDLPFIWKRDGVVRSFPNPLARSYGFVLSQSHWVPAEVYALKYGRLTALTYAETYWWVPLNAEPVSYSLHSAGDVESARNCTNRFLGERILDVLDSSEEWARQNPDRRMNPKSPWIVAHPLAQLQIAFMAPHKSPLRNIYDEPDVSDVIHAWTWVARSDIPPTFAINIGHIGLRFEHLPRGFTAIDVSRLWKSRYGQGDCTVTPVADAGPWSFRVDLCTSTQHVMAYFRDAVCAESCDAVITCFADVVRPTRRKKMDREMSILLDGWARDIKIVQG